MELKLFNKKNTMKITTSHRALFQKIVSKINKKKYVYFIENGKVRSLIKYYFYNNEIMSYNDQITCFHYDKEYLKMELSYSLFWNQFYYQFNLNGIQIKEITSCLLMEYLKYNLIETTHDLPF